MKKIFFFILTLFLFFKINTQVDSSKILKSNILGINHIGVNVKNLEQSKAFYQNVFGLKSGKKYILKKPLRKSAHQYHKSCLLFGPNANIKLTEFDQKESDHIMPIEGPGITHICYQVSSTKPVNSKFSENNATWVSRGNQPIDLGGYGIYYAYVRDPDQILFENEIMDKPHFQEDTWIGHVAIATINIDTMENFYTKFLDKKPHRRSEVLKDNPKLDAIGNIDNIRLKGAWFRTKNMVFEFWEYQNPKPLNTTVKSEPNAIGYQYIVFEVENVKNEYKRLKAIGIQAITKPNKAKNRSFTLLDPEGNRLIIQEIHDESSLKFKKKLTEK